MAIAFSGEFNTPVTCGQAFDFLADPLKFAPLLPDFQSLTQDDATHFTVRLAVAAGTLKSTTDIKMDLREAARPSRVCYFGQGSAFANQIALQIAFSLSPAAAGAVVAWHGEVDVVGNLAFLAGGMLQPLAGKGMSKLMEGLKNALDQTASADPQKTAEQSAEDESRISFATTADADHSINEVSSAESNGNPRPCE